MKPDDNTGPDGTLQYVSVFNPDVLPFKRMTSFDAVHDDFTLHVARTVLTEIPVGGATNPKTRDRFWGDVLIQLKPGIDVPLPSVAPDMRILSYEVKPKIALKFSKDGADNFFVRSDESKALFANVNTSGLEFAPAISADGLVLYFTRVTGGVWGIGSGPKIYRASRTSLDEPFSKPMRMQSIEGFVEAPTLAEDGALYFHKKVKERYEIWRTKE